METLKSFSERNEITYPLLSDEGSKIIDAYGIRNKLMDGKKYGQNDLTGIPHPGSYVLGNDGTILGKLFLKKYQDRHSSDDLITLVEEVTR